MRSHEARKYSMLGSTQTDPESYVTEYTRVHEDDMHRFDFRQHPDPALAPELIVLDSSAVDIFGFFFVFFFINLQPLRQ